MGSEGEPISSRNPRSDISRAIGNGLICRCPRCGRGKLFAGFLTQVARCASCDERLGHFNAGLFLPFIVIMIVAHLLVFAMLEMELNGWASPTIYFAVLIPLSLVAPLVLIRPIKGGLIGLLWALKVSDELDR